MAEFKVPAWVTHLIGVLVGTASFIEGIFATGQRGTFVGGGLGLVAVTTAMKLFHDSKVTPAEIGTFEADARTKIDALAVQGATVAALAGKTADYDRAVGDVTSIASRLGRYESAANAQAARVAALVERVESVEGHGGVAADGVDAAPDVDGPGRVTPAAHFVTPPIPA